MHASGGSRRLHEPAEVVLELVSASRRARLEKLMGSREGCECEESTRECELDLADELLLPALAAAVLLAAGTVHGSSR